MKAERRGAKYTPRSRRSSRIIFIGITSSPNARAPAWVFKLCHTFPAFAYYSHHSSNLTCHDCQGCCLRTEAPRCARSLFKLNVVRLSLTLVVAYLIAGGGHHAKPRGSTPDDPSEWLTEWSLLKKFMASWCEDRNIWVDCSQNEQLCTQIFLYSHRRLHSKNCSKMTVDV